MGRIDNLIISCIIHFFSALLTQPMNGILYLYDGTQIESMFYGKTIIRANKNKHLTYIIVDLTDTTKNVIVLVHKTRKYEMIYDPRHVNTSMPKETAKNERMQISKQ